VHNQLAVPLALVRVGVEHGDDLRWQLDVRGLEEGADRLGVCEVIDLDVGQRAGAATPATTVRSRDRWVDNADAALHPPGWFRVIER
jgi:hypothetical protein